MDCLEFITENVRTLAWPVVAAFFLWRTRDNLGGLIERLVELKLPGGTSAKFEKVMEEAKKAKKALAGADKPLLAASMPAPRIGPEPKTLSPAAEAQMASIETGIDRFFALASISPEAAIVETYNVLESIPETFKKKIPVKARKSLHTVILDLHERGLLDREWIELYGKVGYLKNLAAQGKAKDELNINDALGFQSLCRSLSDKLFEVFNNLPDLKSDGAGGDA